MGMYLGVYRIKENQKDKNHPDTEMLHDDDFEFGKFVGDSAFAMSDGFESDYQGCEIPYCCTTIYSRPKDFDKAIAWVKKTRKIPKGNKDRLLNVLGLMRKDKELWFEYS